MFKQHELVRNIHGSSQPSVTWTVNNDLKAVGKSLTSFFPSALCENEGSAKKRKKKNPENSCVMPWHCWIRPDSSSTAKSHSSWIHFIKSAFNFKKETCCGWVELFKVSTGMSKLCKSTTKYLSACLTEDSKPGKILGTRHLSLSCPPQCVRASRRLNRSQPVHCRLSPHKCYCLIVSLDFLGLKVGVLLNVLLV